MLGCAFIPFSLFQKPIGSGDKMIDGHRREHSPFGKATKLWPRWSVSFMVEPLTLVAATIDVGDFSGFIEKPWIVSHAGILFAIMPHYLKIKGVPFACRLFQKRPEGLKII